jgi:hypothetical protein
MDATKIPQLSDPRVQAAKTSFETARGKARRKLNIGFDEFFALVAANLLTYEEIGERAGVTRTRAHQLHDKYLGEFFPDDLVGCRSELRKDRHISLRAASQEKGLLDSSKMKPIVARLQAAGCIVEASRLETRTLDRARNYVSHRILLVNTKYRCGVHIAHPKCVRGVLCAQSGIFPNMLRQTHAELFFVSAEGYPEKLFVVPSLILRAAHFALEPLRTDGKTIYLPLGDTNKTNSDYALIDYREFEGAFDLLFPSRLRLVPQCA